MKMKKWKAETTPTPEDTGMLIQAVVQELKGCEPGDWTMNIDPAGGILVIGVVENGALEVYQCKIELSNMDAETQIVEGQFAQMPKQGLLV